MVGLRNGWQTALVMAGLTTKVHAKRLAQGTEVVLEMRAAGEWPFPCWVALRASGNNPLRLQGNLQGDSRSTRCAGAQGGALRAWGWHEVSSRGQREGI